MTDACTNIDTPLRFLTTADHQQIAYAVIGDPALTPLLFLHGGPGSHANPGDAKLFNLNQHFVVMFDQRGCGRSLPSGDILSNTTQHLINDIEQLRITLNIKQWRVYGGSWGAALALEYAKRYPGQVISIILRGAFLARKQDLDWFIRPDGVATKYPEAYRELVQDLRPIAGEPLTTTLYRLLANTNNYNAALAWDNWEATVAGHAQINPETNAKLQQKRIAAKLVYAHYCHHQFFLGDQGVMLDLERLRGIPITLIHGNNDQVCRLSAAKELASALPDPELIVVEAGHSLYEEGIKQALWQLLRY